MPSDLPRDAPQNEESSRLLVELLHALQQNALIRAVLSDPVTRSPDACHRITARPVRIRDRDRLQLEYREGARVTHRNLEPGEAARVLEGHLGVTLRQAILFTTTEDIRFHRRESGPIKIVRSDPTREPETGLHDRPKDRLLPEGSPVDFLVRLGIMGPSGKVLARRFDKYRQINRFLEIVADAVDTLQPPVRVVDFGCGKGYLTFGLYHYLHRIRGLEVAMTGVDRRRDLVESNVRAARELQMEGLDFEAGEIQSYEPGDPPQCVVALHACDTATDDALARAIGWNARLILAAPCCQQELSRQIVNPAMRPLLKHGLLRERLSSLITDAVRGELLELFGYGVQMVEFIAPEHTPKNLLIRAVQRDFPIDRNAIEEQYRLFQEFWGVHPALERLLGRV